MDKKHLGLIFKYSENWIGGTYYLLNIIHALNTLPEVDQPIISIMSPDKADFNLVKDETSYTKLNYIKFPRKPSLFDRFINKIIKVFTGTDSVFVKTKLQGVDFVYPFFSDAIANKNISKVHWIPDFQEVYLPHLFSDEEIRMRKRFKNEIVKDSDLIVFSSEDSRNHFNEIYPNNAKRTEVIQFAVTHPSLEGLEFSNIKAKYQLPEKYFFAPNQFWRHKNHMTVLKALTRIKEKYENIKVVFSGKEDDYRAPGYFESILEYVEKNNLSDYVSFLGFIDRREQLMILKNCKAVIQPSSFEGWSTVVEDAKAKNRVLILSNLAVHREQMKGRNAYFFEVGDDRTLSQLMIDAWRDECHDEPGVDYNVDVAVFAKKFMKMVNTNLKI